MKYMKARTLDIVRKKECWEKTGKVPISTKWADTDKTHGEKEIRVRSRLVARDFKTRGERNREDSYCAPPPLELLRFLVGDGEAGEGKSENAFFIDLRKAHRPWV